MGSAGFLFAQSSSPKQKIRLAYSYELMYHESEHGRPLGMLVPLINLLRDEFDMEVELYKLNREKGFQALDDGDADIYGMIGLGAERRKNYLFTEPLYRAEGAIVTRVDHSVFSLIHLQGRKVGLLEDSTLTDTILNFVDSPEHMVFFPTQALLLDALENGGIDCIAAVEGTEIEVLQRKDVRFEFPISSFFIDQGLLCKQEKFRPVIERINQVLESPEGELLRQEIGRQRSELILRYHREMLAKEIAHVRERFEVVNMYDTGLLYPFCFRENDTFKGVVVDVARIFTQLTDIEVRIGDHNCGSDGMVAALEKIRSGECQLTLGGYANVAQARQNGLDFSSVLWTDTIRPYSYGPKKPELYKSRVGMSANLTHYFPWDNILENPPITYGSRAQLVGDLKKRKLDVVILGDMILNYQHSVLRDFNFQSLDGLSAEIEMHLVYGKQNPELNRLFDEAVRLYPILSPQAYDQWKKRSERANADYIRARDAGRRWSYVVGIVLVLLVATILLILYRFVKYDWQIRKLLRKQQTLDLLWIDLRKHRIISKGDHPFLRVWGMDFSGSLCSLRELEKLYGRELEADYLAVMKKMKDEGKDILVSDAHIVAPRDGQIKHYRRYFHRIDDYRFMLCLQDINAQWEAERQEQFLVQLFDAFKDGLLFIGKDLKVLRFNRAMEELFPDYNPEKDHCFDCFRGGNAPCEGCPVRETFWDGQKHVRVEFYEKTGRWLELTSYPIKDAHTGEVDRVLEFVRDVTEQRERENELESREKFLAAILNASNDGIVAISDGGEGGTHINSRLSEMFGGVDASYFSTDNPEALKRHDQTTFNSDEIYRARDHNRLTNEPGSGTLYFRDGRIYQWRLASTQTGIGKTGYTRVWTYHDATEEVRISQQIKESEEYLRTLFETMPCGLGTFHAVRDESGEVVDFVYDGINAALERITGVDREHLEDQSILKTFPHVRVVSGPMKDADLFVVNKAALDGSLFSCLVHNPSRDTYQQVISFYLGPDRVGTFVVDETARIASEQASRRSEERFSILFNTMPNGLALFDVVRDDDGRPTDFLYSQINPALEKINGFSSESVHGKTVREIMPDIHRLSEDYRQIDSDEHWIFPLGREALQGETDSALMFNERDGTYHRLTAFSPGPDQVGVFITDVTEMVVTSRSLQESEQRISSLFTSMTNGIVMFDIVRDSNGKAIDFRISHANPACCKTMDVSLDEWKGRSVLKMFDNSQVITQEFDSRWWGGIELAAEGIGGTYHVEFPQLVSAPYQEIVIFPVGTQQVGLILYDETHRLRSERQLKLMQLIIDRISHPVFWLYLDGTVQYANDAAAIAWGFDATGIAPDGPIGNKVWDYDSSVAAGNWQNFIDRFKDSRFLQFDTVMNRKDGTRFPAVVTVNLLEQQGAPFFAAGFQDLTDQTRRIKAEQQALAKSSFLDHMSHEIRTPLNGVIGIADLMLGTELTDKQREYVELARLSGQHLLSIVSNILDYSIIDGGELVLDDAELDLPELIESLRQVILSQITERKANVTLDVVIHPDVPQYILGDALRLRQIIFNLLDNAVKFTQDGNVSLDIALESTMPAGRSRTEKTGRFLSFAVKDTGIGISETMMTDLFESFVMGDASFSRKYGGTGLGLPIARGLVYKMDGEIYVESEVGLGSTFWFLIPLRVPKQPGESSIILPDVKKQTVPRDPAEMTILVVEDNRINRIVTGEMLKQAGYNFDFAENGLEACNAVVEKKFDFILMDCQMPVMDGFEATRRIRAMEAGTDERHAAHTGRIPIVALTANALAGDERNCIDAGMDGFCSKPINAEQLLEMIRQWTGRT